SSGWCGTASNRSHDEAGSRTPACCWSGTWGKASMDSVNNAIRRTLLQLGGASALTDGELLARFVATREQAAFEGLVRRHGPMVLRVCRRILHQAHDAEDAFQATFIVLMRKAHSLARQELLANWLYGVAYRVALKARAGACHRQTREKLKGESLLEDCCLTP